MKKHSKPTVCYLGQLQFLADTWAPPTCHTAEYIINRTFKGVTVANWNFFFYLLPKPTAGI